jgi:hypothetical protein
VNIQHTLCIDHLNYFKLLNLVIVFVALCNATDILHQWHHLALKCEVEVALKINKLTGADRQTEVRIESLRL